MGLDAFKKVASAPAAKKSKSTTPVVELEELSDQVKTWVEAKKNEKDAKARLSGAGEEIKPVAEEARRKICMDTGNYASSVKIKAGGETITMSTKNAYSKIPTEQAPQLDEIFGEDKDKFFKEKMTIALTDAAMNDEEIVNKLVEAVGAENLAKYFDIKQFIEPTEALHTQRSTDAKVAAMADRAINEGVLRPYSPSFRKG
jgi:hypothetical protein